jgi:aerobic-type carbon monoxide dehydrogenase small subunit (CoxS/CutS family)
VHVPPFGGRRHISSHARRTRHRRKAARGLGQPAQRGYCINGMVMTTKAFLERNWLPRKRRRLMISASAPAGIASRKIGRLAATCTRRDDQRIRTKAGHQPARRGRIHPRTDIGG